MNKTRMGKRVASLLLSLVMMLSLLPTAAYATMADGVDTQGASVSENGTGVSNDSNSGGDTGDLQVGDSEDGGTADDTTGAEGGNDSASVTPGNRVEVNGTVYDTLEAAIAAAEPVNGVITYEIYGKVEANSTESWIEVLKDGLTDVTKVAFVGKTNDAEISITNSTSVLADQNYDIDVSFVNLILSHSNGAWVGDLGHATEYFTCVLRNTDAANNTVTYTNCTFPNGACNNQYGKTVFDNCKFTNATSGKYNLWNYGGTTEITNSAFTGTRGVKTYNEGTLAESPEVAIKDTTFTGLTEKAAIVASKPTDIKLDSISATECTKGVFQKDIEGSTDAEKVTIEANGSGISGNFNVTAEKAAEAAKGEFNITAGSFTAEVPGDYCAEGFTIEKNTDGSYGVKEDQPSANVAKVGSTEYATLADAVAALNSSSYTLQLLDDTAWDAATPVYWAAGTQSGYAATLADALTAAYKANAGAITIVCRPNADVGKLTHGHVADDITIYGNNAYISSGECDLEVDTYMYSRETGKQVTTGGAYLDKDITVTAYELDNLGVWGERHTDHKVTVNLTDCDTVNGITAQRVYISGTTGVNDITLTGCDFGTKATSVYSNADGAVVIDNCSFTGAQVPVNFNHKAGGTQTVTVRNSKFTNCGDNGDWKQFAAPVRFVNSGSGTMDTSVDTCTFTGTVGGNGDILLGDGREGQKSNDVKLNVENTAANVQAQQPGYYGDGGTTDESKLGTKTVAADKTLTTSVNELVSGETYVAAVGEKTFASLQAAIDAAGRNATVKLLADTYENVTIATAMTLDLNGHTLNGGTVKATPALKVDNCSVTVKDSSAAQTGTIMREDTAENSGVSSHYVIDIQGKYGFLKFEGGNVKNNSGTTSGKGASLIRLGNDNNMSANPTLTIKGGTFTQDNFIAIKVDHGTLHLLDGTVNSTNSFAVENWNNAYIKGGTVNGTVSTWVYSTGAAFSKLTISGGTVNGNVASVNYDNAADKQARVYVTGGTVNGTLGTYTYGNGLIPINDAAKATIAVTGGTFSSDPTKYVVEDSGVTPNGDGTYGVAKAYLAKVGGTSYYTMDEAFKAQTASGEAIVLLRDYTTGSTFNSGTVARTVDLNGHTWTCTGTDANSAAFEINNPNATLIVKNGKVVSSQLVGLIPSAMGGTIKYDNSTLVFDGVEMTTTARSGIETNGNNTNDTVTLKNSTLNVPNGFGIYFPSSGTLTIENSKINAKTMGVQVCSGSLNITGDQTAITVSGDGIEKTGNDGAIEDGAAISIVERTGYKGLSEIKVSGGTFKANGTNDAVKAYKWENQTASSFTQAEKVSVSGGTFSSAVDKSLCADGFIPTENTDGTYGVKEETRGTEARPYTLAELGVMTRAEYVAAQEALGGTMYVAVGNYTYDKNGVLGNGERNDTPGQNPDHSKLNAYGENGYLNEKNDGANGKNIVFVNGSITSGATGYTSIDNIGTSLLLAVPAYTNVTFKGIAFNNVMSFNYQLYTSPWSQLGELKFDGCTFNGIIVGAIAAQTLTFNGCTFTNYTNTTSANSSNPTWIRPAYGNWTAGDNKGQGDNFRSLTKINFTGNTVTSTRPVKFEYISQWDIRSTVTVTNNSFDISAQEGDTEIKNVGLYLGAHTKTNAFDLVAEGNTKSDNTAALYTIPAGETSLPLGSTVTDTNGNQIELIDALKWKAADAEQDKIVLKTVKAVASVGTVNFATLAEAIGAAQDGQTVTLLADATEDVVISKSITLDLGGKTLTNTNAGKATISVTGGTVTVKNGNVVGGTGYYNIEVTKGSNANLTLTDVTATAGNTGSSMIDNWGTLTITSGDYSGGLNVVKSEEGSKLTITGGTFTGNYATNGYTGVILVYGDTTISGGEFIQSLTTTGRWNHPQVIATGVVEGYTAITRVTGGHFVNKMSGESIFRGIGKATSDNFEVSGGTFNKAISDAFCADGFIPVKQSDGTYGVKEGKFVAEVGSTGYETFDEAIAAANASTKTATIYLRENITVDHQLVINNAKGKAITLDLQKHTLTSTYAINTAIKNGSYALVNNTPLTIKNGTFAAGQARAIGALERLTLNGATVTQQLTGGHACVAFCADGKSYTIKDSTIEGAYAVCSFADNATITITGSKLTGTGNTLYHNGSNYGLKLTVKDTTITSSGSCGVYISGSTSAQSNADNQNGAGKYQQATFTGCTISGALNGVEVKYTDLTLDGCAVSTTAEDASYKQDNNGPAGSGFAVVSTDNAMNNVTPKPEGTIIIKGTGKYTGPVGLGSLKSVKETYADFADETIKISGGTFTTEIPAAYCADGFIPTQNEDGTYGVKVGQYVAEVGSTKYETLADAVAAAQDGQTVTLLCDVEQNTQLTINKSITLDLNGKTIKNTEDIWSDNANAILSITNGAKVTITGNGTIAAKENDCYTINVVNGDLTIENGTFVGNISVVQVQKGSLTINGGAFSLLQKMTDGKGENRYLINCIDSEFTSGNANVAISGGTFVGFDPNVSPEQKVDGKAPSFAAPGAGITKNEDGSFTAAAGMTAQILDKDGNSVKAYESLAEAVAAAEDGQTVRLLADVTESNIKVNANITIDLNKMTVTGSFVTNGEVTIQNGTIDVPDGKTNYAYGKLTLADVDITGKAASSSLLSVNYNGSVTIDKDSTIVADSAKGNYPAVFIKGQDDSGKTYAPELNIYGTVQSAKTPAIQGNGTDRGVSHVNVFEGAVVKSESLAVYLPQPCEVNITGGLVEGYCGIGIKSGTLNISGGTVRGVANDNVIGDEYSQTNGISYDGSAIMIDSYIGYAGQVQINISGNAVVESKYSTAIREIGNDKSQTNLVGLDITGGTVLGAEDTVAVLVRDVTAKDVNISGGEFSSIVKKEYCAPGFTPVTTANSEGRYGVEVGKFTVKVTSRTTGSDSPVANVAGGGSDITYAEGTTVTASAISGYNFVGWFVNEYTGTAYSTDLTCEVKPTDDCTMIAVYEPISGGKFWLTVTASEFTVNGGAVQDSYLYEQFAVGASVTVNFTGSENFLYWVNASNKVVSTDKSYSFIMGSETTLKAVYGKARQNQATVVFISHSDQIISSKAYTTSDTIQFPVPPIKMGCTFTGWSMTEAEIRAAMANNSGIIQVRALYTEPSIACKVTVVYPEGTDDVVVNAVVGKAIDVTAKDIEGKTFSYWTDNDGNVLGYTKTLKLAPSGDTTVKAVYDEAAEVKPVITISEVSATTANESYVVTFMATRAVPDGYKVVKQGILWSRDAVCGEDGAAAYMQFDSNGKLPNGVNAYIGNSSELNGVTRLDITTKYNDRTFYGRGYMVLESDAGKLLYIYTNTIASGSYDSLTK